MVDPYSPWHSWPCPWPYPLPDSHAKANPTLLHPTTRSGNLEGKQVAVNFISDIARDLRLLRPDGSRNPAMTTHDSTKRLYGLLSHHGGPKSVLFLTASLGTISEDTVSRHWKNGLFRLDPGVNEATFEYV